MSDTVVYIDDEPAICRIVGMRLEAAGLPVRTFTDAPAAVEWVARHGARCVLCDHRMPDLSGLEVREQLDAALRFWLVTGDLSIADELDGRADVQGVLRKPIDFDALLTLVRALPVGS